MKTNIITYNALRFVGLLLLQLAVINNINVNGYIDPYIYILFIILLPINISTSLSLILAFSIGIVNDFFASSGGIHAAACVGLAFFRPAIIKLLSPPGGYEEITNPDMRDLGFTWFITYSVILIFIYHLMLFFLEIFSFEDFLFIILKTAISSAFSLLFIVLGVFIFNPK